MPHEGQSMSPFEVQILSRAEGNVFSPLEVECVLVVPIKNAREIGRLVGAIVRHENDQLKF